MTEQQRTALAEMLRNGPLDLGGVVAEQRVVFDRMMGALPIPEDVVTEPGSLGGIGVIDIRVPEVSSENVILYLHGGAYAIGSAASSVGLASDVGRAARTRVVTVDYRLAPEHVFPAAVTDALAAYQGLLASGTPAERIALVGESAGGGLVLATLLALKRDGVPQPAAAAVFSPWADLSLSGESLKSKAAVDPAVTEAGLRRRAGDYAGADHTTNPLASPVLGDLTGLPPLLIQAGSHEILLDDALRLAARAAEADVAVTLEITPGVPHVFQAFSAMLDEAGAALAGAGAFLQRHFPS